MHAAGLLFGALLSFASGAVFAQAESRNLAVTMPNGYAHIAQEDLWVESTAGTVYWARLWDGQEWKFNPHWESLSQSWRNLTGSKSADTAGSNITGDTPGGDLVAIGTSNPKDNDEDGCWVWVDEDWEPTVGTVVIGGVPQAGPMQPERTAPFNKLMGEDSASYAPAMRVNIDYANLCAGSLMSRGAVDLEGIRRQNELYLGGEGRYAFSNRAVLEKRAVQQLAQVGTEGVQQLLTGSYTVAPVNNPRGYRWIHKEGDWIDYNTQGQIVSYGDANDNIVWMVRENSGLLRGVVDAAGHVIYTLHYTGGRITEIRDYPVAGNALDLPARRVQYQYDEKNRLTHVIDARGNTTQYGYDGANRIVSVTDQEGRVELLEYTGYTVKKRTAPDGAVSEYLFEYDDTNKQFISKITGPETESGRRVEDHTHNRAAKPVRRIINGRIEEEVRYDTGARAELHTNARGFVTRITHNEFDQIVRVDHPDGTSEQRTYSPLHLQMTEAIDEAGVKTQYQYDTKGNLLRRTEAAATPVQRVIDYEVNALGQRSRATARGRTETNGTVTPDAVWMYEHDSQGQLSQITDAEGNVAQYVFNRAGNLVSYTDARGHTTRYEVNAHGRLTRIIDPLDRTTSFAYDRVGNLVTRTDARGNDLQAAYDAMNRRTQIVNPVGGIRRIEYNGQGMPVLESDADGRIETAEFDPFQRLTRRADALGNVTQYSYDLPDGTTTGTVGALFDPTQVVYPTYTERLRYDRRERPTNLTLLNTNSRGTEGLVSSATYEARGLLKTYTDENGKTTSYAYDANGRLVEMTDSLGNKSSAQYDARGNLLQIRDTRGNVSRFEYDRINRLVKEILPLGQTTSYEYNAVGNLSQRIDPNGHRAEYDYDDANRIREIRRYRNGATLVRTTVFTWDDADNLTAWSDVDATRPAGQQTTSSIATYDDANRLSGETITYPNPAGGAYSLSYGYQYSLGGYKTRLTWPDGTAIEYAYSEHGQLSSVTIPGEGTLSVNQFKWLAPERITLPGGSTQVRSYDGLLNLEELKVRTPGQQTVLDLSNAYGKAQELKSHARVDTVDGVSTGISRSITYDNELRVTQVDTDNGGVFGNDTETFTLDALGNRIAHSKVSGAWSYDANNRLLQKGVGANATTYDYDDAGNLVRKTEPGGAVTQYVHDTQNRLVQVNDGAGNPIARYGYDIFDERLWKEHYRSRGGALLSQPKRTYYLYAGEGLIAEAVQAVTLNGDGTVSADSSVNGGQPSLTTQYGPKPNSEFTTGTLFVKTVNSNGQTTIAYYHGDQLGTPLSASDSAGKVVWAASYDLFGGATITTPAATADKPTIASNLRFPGQYFDEETGLHYNMRRYYDPTIGRYISQDPMGFEGGENFYSYAAGDPANLTDPTGECPACIAYATCFAACMLQDAAVNAITGECNNFAESAKNCALGCAIGLGLAKAWEWGRRLLRRNPCGSNSFEADTLVHVRPQGAADADAETAKSELRSIKDIQVGDQVLSFSEWKEAGATAGRDARLSYEKVVDVYTSLKEQRLVHLTLSDGQKLTATEGHPFKTTEGWRDAVQLTRGGKLLLRGSSDEHEQVAVIEDLRIERRVISALNLEVANAHSFFVGDDGVLVHNGNGSYTCYFKSGKTYDGKGDYDRAKQSAREKEEMYDDELEFLDWTPADNEDDAFRDEYQRQLRNGGPQGGAGGDGSNYNKRWSPGRHR